MGGTRQSGAMSSMMMPMLGNGGRALQRVRRSFCLFLHPPPSTVAEVCLQRFKGNWLVFIGEWRGCTATSAFFDELEVHWEVLMKVELPQWPMMDDGAWVMRRRLP